MKKKLLKIFLLVCACNFGFAQQGRLNHSMQSSDLYGSPVSSSNPKGSQSAVITTTTSTCMSINLPAPATWSLVNYGTGGPPIFSGGFVNGPNSFGDKEKAMYFDVSATANTSVTHVYVGFDHAYSATASKVVTLRLYDGTTANVVGAQLGTSATLTMGTIMSDVAANQYSDFLFTTPIALPASKKFYASVDVTALTFPSDSLSIVSNTDPQSTPTPAWEKQSTNVWYNYSSASSWSLNISMLIHPFLIQSPVISTFSASNNTICTGNTVNYNSTGSTSTGTYYWSFGASLPTATSNVASPTGISYPSTGTYTTYLLVNDACGSYAVSSKTILVNQTPAVGATPTATNVCSGGNVTLAGTGATSYAWTGGITNNVPFTATSSVNYTVTGTAANGCTAAAVSSVIVSVNPTVTINSSTLSVCSGNSVTLSGAGAVSYVWTGGVNNGIPFAPSSTNSYTVTGTQGICSGTAAVNITVNNSPTVTANASASLVCTGNSVTVSGGGASTYTWTGGVTNATPFTPTATANYVVTGVGSNSCTGTATVNVAVSLCTGLANGLLHDTTIRLYPNPNNGMFTIENTNASQNAVVMIFDNIGKLIYQQNIAEPVNTINTNFASGIYVVKVLDNNSVQSVHKLIIN